MFVLSIVAAIIVAGHIYSLYTFRPLWPFDHYPMYSFPVKKLRYPIVAGDSLTMFTILEVLPDGSERDLLTGADIYPPDFHPLDRLEVMLLLINAGLASQLMIERNSDHFGRELSRAADRDADAGPRLQIALEDLLHLATHNRRELKTIRLVKMRWDMFRSPTASMDAPDYVCLIAEASRD